MDHPSVHPSIHPSVCPSVRPSIYLTIRPSIRPSVCPSIRPSIRLSQSVRPSIPLSLSVRLSIPVSVHLSVCLSACLSVCLSVCWSIQGVVVSVRCGVRPLHRWRHQLFEPEFWRKSHHLLRKAPLPPPLAPLTAPTLHPWLFNGATQCAKSSDRSWRPSRSWKHLFCKWQPKFPESYSKISQNRRGFFESQQWWFWIFLWLNKKRQWICYIVIFLFLNKSQFLYF